MKTVPQSWSRIGTRMLAVAAQMDWFRGLRAGVALCAPLLLGDVLGMPDLGWAALGGFEAILADTGGPYRTRIASLATLSLGGATGLFVGSLAGGNLRWAFPVTLLFCFAWSYLAVLGQPFSSAGLLVQVIFICGIGAPTSDLHGALTHALLLLAGGAWATVLSLLLWPLDAYRPVRAAVAGCYEELASFLASISTLAGRVGPVASRAQAPSAPPIRDSSLQDGHPADLRPRTRPALWHRLARHHQYRIRRAVETGWQAVAAIRAERQSETAEGHHLVVLLEHADLLIARTIALAEHLENDSVASRCDDRSLSSLADLRAAAQCVASILVKTGVNADAVQAGRTALQRVPTSLQDCVDLSSSGTRFLIAQIIEAASLLDTSLESASLARLGKTPAIQLNGSANPSVGHAGDVVARLAGMRQGWNLGRVRDELTANFSAKSLILRHAGRVALVCGLDVTIVLLFKINHGYWLLMTSLIVLQPHVSGTMRRGLERIGGTVGGGIVAALLAVTLHSQLATAAVLFPLAWFAIAILPVSYTAFAFFLTPAFVLAWLPYSGDWQLALIRTGNTIGGAAISLLAMAFLFPIYERDRAAEFLRASLSADRRYLAQLADSWRTRSRSSRLLAQARRATGLAHNDTEESLERLFAESWPRRRPFAQFVASFVTYLRRFAQSVTTLTALDGEWEWKLSGPVQSRLELLDRRLQWLEQQTWPEPGHILWPEPGTLALGPAIPTQDHPGEPLLERLERQAEVLHRQLQSLREHGWLPGSPKS